MSSLFKALAYGAASIALYVLLYLYADETVELARRTHEGERIWFLAPIVIAFVFSYVHGAFTGYFWDAIGLSPAGKQRRK
jgi:predicted membrane-bound dolichyl-phosphate-mannose-protein mannosyltransferase